MVLWAFLVRRAAKVVLSFATVDEFAEDSAQYREIGQIK
jgi:hypothetical protein